MDNLASVKVAGRENPATIPISSSKKPTITEEILTHWQEIVDLAAQILDIPAGLIMRLHQDEIEVFVKSSNQANPYELNERARLQSGIYCETVVGKRQALIVPNALKDPDWDHNPDIDLNMLSYLGIPISWPDGEIFGTLCVLDSKENTFTPDQRKLIEKFGRLVERDLALLSRSETALQQLAESELKLRETRHRIRNHFNLLVNFIDFYSTAENQSLSLDELSAKIRNRVYTLLEVHEMLSHTGGEAGLSGGSYIDRIVEAITRESTAPIAYRRSGAEFVMNEDELIPLGMLLNELVSNSIKYGFTDQASPMISIDISRKEQELTLIYRDNGGSTYDGTPQGTGLGSMIIEALISQMQGESTERIENGYYFSIRLALREE